MKLRQVPLILLAALLPAAPAFAQATEHAAYKSAGIISWILVGLVGGYLASRVVNKSGEGFFLDIILGIIGGGIAGEIFQAFGHPGVTGFNLWSILVAFFGGVIVLLVYHAVRGQPKKSG